MNLSNKNLLNATKCQCYSFHRFWVIKGKPTEEVKIKVYLRKVYKGKSLLEYTNLFAPDKYKKTEKIMLKYFQ